MRQFQIFAGALLLLAAVGGAIWFFAIEERRPGIAGSARFAARVMGVAVCGAIGLGLFRGGLAMPPREKRPTEERPAESQPTPPDEEEGW